MATNRTSLYLPTEVEQIMKQLAVEHDRSLNGEIIQACKAWIKQESRKPMTNEIETINRWADTMLEQAANEMVGKMDITPANLSRYFTEHFELELTEQEALDWLKTRSWWDPS